MPKPVKAKPKKFGSVAMALAAILGGVAGPNIQGILECVGRYLLEQ